MKRVDLYSECECGTTSQLLEYDENTGGDWISADEVLHFLDVVIFRAEARPLTPLPVLKAHRDLLLSKPVTIKVSTP